MFSPKIYYQGEKMDLQLEYEKREREKEKKALYARRLAELQNKKFEKENAALIKEKKLSKEDIFFLDKAIRKNLERQFFNTADEKEFLVYNEKVNALKSSRFREMIDRQKRDDMGKANSYLPLCIKIKQKRER